MELGTYMDYDIYDQWTCYNKLQFDGTIILRIASHYQYVTHDSLSTSLVMKNVVEVPRMFYSSIDQLDKMLDLDLETILQEYYPAICYKNNINICLTISYSMIPTWNEISLELSLILKVILWTLICSILHSNYYCMVICSRPTMSSTIYIYIEHNIITFLKHCYFITKK